MQLGIIRGVAVVFAALAFCSTASAQLVVYDYTSGGLFNSARPTNVGDFGVFGNALGTPGPNQVYEFTAASVARVQGGTGTAGGTVDIGFFLWDNVNTSAAANTPVFSGLLGFVTFERAVAAGGTAAGATTNITFNPGAVRTDDSTFGYQLIFAANDTIVVNGDTVTFTPSTSGMTAGLRGLGTSGQGASSNGWLQDVDADGILESTEGVAFAAPNDVNSNVHLSLTAQLVTVPEPASFAVLGLAGALALVRRRR